LGWIAAFIASEYLSR